MLVFQACGCPLYWKAPLFIACGGEKLGYVELNMVLDFWREYVTFFLYISRRILNFRIYSLFTTYCLPYYSPSNRFVVVSLSGVLILLCYAPVELNGWYVKMSLALLLPV